MDMLHAHAHPLYGGTRAVRTTGDGPNVFRPACRRADITLLWMFQHLVELSGTAEDSGFFEKGCMAIEQTLPPYHLAREEFGISSGKTRIVSRSVKETLPAGIAELFRRLGWKVRRNLRRSKLQNSLPPYPTQ